MVNDDNVSGWYRAFHFLQVISLLCSWEHTCVVGRVGITDFSLEMRKIFKGDFFRDRRKGSYTGQNWGSRPGMESSKIS